MDREQIEAMLAEQEATMQKLQGRALQVQGAIAVLKEQLKQIDAAEAAKVPVEE